MLAMGRLGRLKQTTKHWIKYWLYFPLAAMANFVKVPIRAKGLLNPRFQRSGDLGFLNLDWRRA